MYFIIILYTVTTLMNPGPAVSLIQGATQQSPRLDRSSSGCPDKTAEIFGKAIAYSS